MPRRSWTATSPPSPTRSARPPWTSWSRKPPPGSTPTSSPDATRVCGTGAGSTSTPGRTSLAGTVPLSGELDLPDALALDEALAQGAADLATLGSTESLDVRRATALGEMARAQLPLDLTSVEPVEGATVNRHGFDAAPV